MQANEINSVLLKKPKGSYFDMTHDVKLSCNMGDLVPIFCKEVLPGDKFKLDAEVMVRMAPMVAPMMHRVDIYIHYFYAPNRILSYQDQWEGFVRGDEIAQPFISFASGGNTVAKGSLADYLGMPPGPLQVGVEWRVLAYPFAMYQRVFYEYYRDQNLYTDMPDEDKPFVTAGENSALQFNVLRKRAWQHDYFTACLPFTQKGDESAVNFQFDDLPVLVNDNVPGFSTVTMTGDTTNPKATLDNTTTAVGNEFMYVPTSEMSGPGFTINEFRRALALQSWLERMAVGGTRYIEIIRAHFGVMSSDKRLDRPEYIGGLKTPMVISEVLNTSATEDEPQGNMSGHGIGVGAMQNESYYAEEHGWIMGIMSIMPKTAYQQGIPRELLLKHRNTRDEYYWPQFAHLGEQEVSVEEVFADTPDKDSVFGYLPRYSEYRLAHNRVAGDFRDTLNHWHMGRIFDTKPSLNQDFIESDPTFRIFAVTDPDLHHLYCHVLNKVGAYRLMPKYATPQIVG